MDERRDATGGAHACILQGNLCVSGAGYKLISPSMTTPLSGTARPGSVASAPGRSSNDHHTSRPAQSAPVAYRPAMRDPPATVFAANTFAIAASERTDL